MNDAKALTLPKAILFDMDGTLTQPLLNFDEIRRDMGIGNGPILETLSKMSKADRIVAEKILHHHEDRAAEESTLNVGCHELLEWLERAGILTALVTRNTRRSVDTVFRRHRLNFEICITREDGKYKPDPAPLRLGCSRLNVLTADAWMVGDGYHDIEAGVAAAMRTVWISHGSERSFAAVPSMVMKDLPELLGLLQTISRG
jgi:HAD superfamily hydrolase (TIGR01509 family)